MPKCQHCPKEFARVTDYDSSKRKFYNYAYQRYCSRACALKAFRVKHPQEPKKSGVIRGALIHDDILQCTALRAEQKLAMTVLKQAKLDIENLAPKWKDGLGHELRMALASALRFIFCDNASLVFWCTIAGWDAEAVQEQCYKLVDGVDWRPMLRVHRTWVLPSGKEIVH